MNRYSIRFLAGFMLFMAAIAFGDAVRPAQAQSPGPAHRVFLPVTLTAVLAPPALDQWSYFRTAQVLAVALDEANGIVWAGTDDGAVRWNQRTGERRTFTVRDGLASDLVTDLALDGAGGVWLAHGRTDAGADPSAGDGVSYRSPDGRWTKVTRTDGLASNTVFAIERSPDGSLWFATSVGASKRFPGGQWVDAVDPNAGNRAVRALAFDRPGNLWLRTYGGLSRLATNGTWQSYPATGVEVGTVAADAAGNAWFSNGEQGVTMLRPDASRQSYTVQNGLPSPFVEQIAIDAADNRWFAAYDRISRMSAADGSWTPFLDQNSYASVKIEDLIFDGQQRPWIATLGHVQWQEPNGRWQALDTAVQLGSNQVTDIEFGADGRPWIATQASGFAPGGVSTLSSTGDWEFYEPVVAAHGGDLSARDWQQVQDLAQDRDGSLWIATSGGAVRRTRDGQWTHFTQESGLATNEVLAVEVDQQGGVWFANTSDRGEVGAGVSHRRADGTWETVTKANGLADDVVTGIFAGPRGDMWFVHWDEISIRSAAGSWRHVGLMPAAIYAIAFDRSNQAWLATHSGVYQLGPDEKAVAHFTRADGLPSDDVRAISMDAEGRMWVGTDRGAARQSPDGRWVAYNSPGQNVDRVGSWNQVATLAFNPRGEIWLGTSAGLAVLR
jgi:ligand-binding sensor domain-containing protein